MTENKTVLVKVMTNTEDNEGIIYIFTGNDEGSVRQMGKVLHKKNIAIVKKLELITK